jgi:hypothetical protein
VARITDVSHRSLADVDIFEGSLFSLPQQEKEDLLVVWGKGKSGS